MLDKNYYPMYLYARDFRAAAEKAGAKAFEVALERGEGEVARYSSVLYASAHEEENFRYLERIVKFMLWAYGGYKFYFYGVDEKLIEKLKRCYSASGDRAFDYEFMKGEPATLKVYEMEHPDVLLWAVWTIQKKR